jgi:hypothetical protein
LESWVPQTLRQKTVPVWIAAKWAYSVFMQFVGELIMVGKGGSGFACRWVLPCEGWAAHWAVGVVWRIAADRDDTDGHIALAVGCHASWGDARKPLWEKCREPITMYKKAENPPNTTINIYPQCGSVKPGSWGCKEFF